MKNPQRPSGLIVLKKIMEGTSSSTGHPFFESLVKNLSEVLDVFGVWVTEYLKDSNRLRAIAFHLDGKFVDEYEYQVEGTPCEPVINSNSICHFPTNVIELFPKDPDLPSLGAVSYMGIALRDVDGSILGHLAILDNKPMEELPESYAILEIFASRATAELRRLKADQLLKENEEKLNRLINGTQEYVIEFDEYFNITQYNQAASKSFDLPAYLLNSSLLTDLFDQEGQKQILKSTNYLKSEQNRHNTTWLSGNFCGKSFSGKSFPVEASLSKYEYKQKLFFAMFIRNVKEQMKSKEQIKQLNLENLILQERIRENDFDEIIGESKAVINTLEMVSQVAPTDTNVLLLGETGTGKELFARAVHKTSSRKDKMLVTLNCAALPKELIESELFGHVKGAFTGAVASREGRFSLADKGTIFLDEIGELPLELQAKLLRVLQQGEFEPLGSSQTKKVDIRLIAATNRDLKKEVEQGKFREDLYYRLNVFPVNIPPLRERGEDILILANAFISKFAKQKGKIIQPLTEVNKQRLLNYQWPGNVRELQNIIERCVILSRDGRLDFSQILPPYSSDEYKSDNQEQKVLTEEALRDIERHNLILALEKTNWKIYGENGAAELLGIPHTTLNSRMKKFGIRRR